MLFGDAATADVRIASQGSFCRVVIATESHHGTTVIHDGKVNRAFRKTVRGPVRVCMRRGSIPDVCQSSLTRWYCVTNDKANRTIQFNIR